MTTPLLDIRDLHVEADGSPVIHGVNLSIPIGETHVLFGPNGSGKSSLLATIMGLAPYRVTSGEIWFKGQRIDALPVDKRAQMGLGMSFQRPPALEGVTVEAFTAAIGSSALLESEASALDFNGFAERDVNAGFSGGEIKRWEILKLLLKRPDLSLFDEPESGVDLEHIAAVGKAIDRLLGADTPADPQRTALVITHTGFILDYIHADVGHLMVDGRIVGSADPRTLFSHIKAHGYSMPPVTANVSQTI
ncbi:ATP-binding cassette domain-containing protein [Sphingobium yanoikuyae]|uniref:ATP-binding cassette domain-containing protein n=2 Tax=Sphingobium TaxID=165695 RepID=A0A6P1GEJ7_SPHYA|nr:MULTISPECIES: ABC transporter ATP-binding protein [Sphingobium]MBB4147279.1 Fe-S cluster assembly ATP-binding protein [Sphingobium scionense]QHD66644.1 ATP-binding cassette domain-containing protein [Sphingobium yanoikuyae]